MRFTLSWMSAATFPQIIVSAADTPTSQIHEGARRREAAQEDAQEHRERGGLRAHRHERGDRRGGALVDVRRPDVERHRRDLEQEAAGQQRDPHGGRRRGLSATEDAGERREVERPGRAVDQRQPVEQDPRGQRSEHEVLRGGLVRLDLAAEVPGEDVRRERHQLEPDVDHREVDARGHRHHADGGEHDQGEVLAGPVVVALQVVVRQQHDQRGGEQEQRLEEDGEVVEREHPGEEVRGGVGGAGGEPERHPGGGEGKHGPGAEEAMPGPARGKPRQQDHHGQRRQHQLGEQGDEVRAHGLSAPGGARRGAPWGARTPGGSGSRGPRPRRPA